MRIFNGSGRPPARDSEARLAEFFRLLAADQPPLDAARTAGVSTDRIVRLLSETTFRSAVCGLLDQAQAA